MQKEHENNNFQLNKDINAQKHLRRSERRQNLECECDSLYLHHNKTTHCHVNNNNVIIAKQFLLYNLKNTSAQYRHILRPSA